MYLLRYFSVIVATFFAISQAYAVEEEINYHNDINLKPVFLKNGLNINHDLKTKGLMEGQELEFYIIDSLANAYSFYTNDQTPYVYNTEAGILSMIKRGFSEDNSGTPGNSFNTKNNLFIRESHDWGQSCGEPILVYKNSNYGDARYPSVGSFMFEGELCYIFVAPVTSGEGWDGFVSGFQIFGNGAYYKVENIEHDGMNYIWSSTSSKMIASVTNDGTPYSITISPIFPELDNRDGNNQCATGIISPNSDLDIWSGYIPSQWDSDKFKVVTEEYKQQYPEGSTNDYRNVSYSSPIDIVELDNGVLLSGIVGVILDGNPNERITVGMSKSSDFGKTWSELEVLDQSLVVDYAASIGIAKADSATITYSTAFNALDENNFSFLSTFIEYDYTKDDNDLIKQIVEIYFENGTWGIRKVGEYKAIIGYPSSDPAVTTLTNQMGVELQLSKTVDNEGFLAKFVNYGDYVDPETQEVTEFGMHDVFVVARKKDSDVWSIEQNITNTPGELDRITWIPNIVPSDLKNIPLLKTYTIPKSGTPNDLDWQRELEEPQYVLMGYFDADFNASVEDNNVTSNLEITKIFPNPANDIVTFNFNLPQSGMTQIEIFDVLGNKVADVQNGYMGLGLHSINYNISKINSGIYYLTVTFNGQKTSNILNIVK